MGLVSFLTNNVSGASLNVVQHPARCLRKRLNTNQCDRCMKACPSGAISIQGREVAFAEEKCSDCMSCVAVCPQDAFESCLDLEATFHGLKNRSHSLITCVRQKKSSHEDIAVPCVGIFSSQAISSLLFSSCGSISINLSECGECCNNTVADSFIQRFYDLNNYFHGHKTTEVHLHLQGTQLIDVPCDRRAYLANITKLATRVAAESFIGASSDSLQTEEKGRRVPGKVKLVKDLLGRIEKASQEKISTLFQPELVISDECNVCPLCKGICPTGALSIDRAKSEKTLNYEALDCSSCGLCVEFCKKKAISFRQKG